MNPNLNSPAFILKDAVAPLVSNEEIRAIPSIEATNETLPENLVVVECFDIKSGVSADLSFDLKNWKVFKACINVQNPYGKDWLTRMPFKELEAAYIARGLQ